MVSKLAKSSYKDLKAKGLEPSFEDLVRLNALGLKLEAAKAKNQVNSTWHLPRLAQISETLAFRQPTIGHEIWFDKVARFYDGCDYNTILAVKAYGLSRPYTELPDADDPMAIKTAIFEFSDLCKDYTRDQIYAALNYVMWGFDPTSGEYAAKSRRAEEADGTKDGDWDHCVSLGILNEGRAVLFGISAADMKEMTPQQLSEVINRAYMFHQMSVNGAADRVEGEYYATVDEIEARLTREKNNG